MTAGVLRTRRARSCPTCPVTTLPSPGPRARDAATWRAPAVEHGNRGLRDPSARPWSARILMPMTERCQGVGMGGVRVGLRPEHRRVRGAVRLRILDHLEVRHPVRQVNRVRGVIRTTVGPSSTCGWLLTSRAARW